MIFSLSAMQVLKGLISQTSLNEETLIVIIPVSYLCHCHSLESMHMLTLLSVESLKKGLIHINIFVLRVKM